MVFFQREGKKKKKITDYNDGDPIYGLTRQWEGPTCKLPRRWIEERQRVSFTVPK